MATNDARTEPVAGAGHPVAMQSDAMSIYKPDWREARDRMIQWWATGKADRVVAKVTAPRDGAPPRAPRGSAEQRITDRATVFANLDQAFNATFFGGEAFPTHFVDIGAVQLGAFLGSELEFRDESVWQAPLGFGWDQAERLAFDPSNRWWRFVCDLTEASCRRAAGRYLVTGGAVGGIIDVMANLLGCEETIVAMVKRPDAVHRLRERMTAWARQMGDEIAAIVGRYQRGSVDWLQMWAPERFTSPQCDLSVMLSPTMFRDLVLPEIRDEADRVDHAFYHLDGSAQWRHLEALLSLARLEGIQWSPEPQVAADPLAFAAEFRRAKNAGRKLFIPCPPDKVRPLVEALGGAGLFLSVFCQSEAAAQDVLRDLERLGV
jgi:hypothetical protein